MDKTTEELIAFLYGHKIAIYHEIAYRLHELWMKAKDKVPEPLKESQDSNG